MIINVIDRSNHGVIAVIDLDSPEKGRFDQHDAAGIEALAAMLADRI